MLDNRQGEQYTTNRSEMQTRTRRRVVWFVIGLLIVSAIGGILYVAEQASLPFELRVELALVKHFREAPYSIQVEIARERGVTVEQLLASPYDRWAPKVFVGLLSAYAVAWVIYLAYWFFKFVDREGSNQTPTKQLLL